MFETKLSMDWASAIDKRCSVRKYTAPPTDAQLSTLGALARQLSWQNVRIMLLKGSGMRSNIKGTDVYAVVIAQKGALIEQLGYAGEALVLQCTAMGLGTCWLGMFYKGVVRIAAKLKEGEEVQNIIAIGQCEPQTPQYKRKPLTQLTGLSEEALAALPKWQQEALRCARLAPSAIRIQPWRFMVSENAITVEKYGFTPSSAPLDCGIAMMHIALGAFHEGVQGKWKESGTGGWTFQRT